MCIDRYCRTVLAIVMGGDRGFFFFRASEDRTSEILYIIRIGYVADFFLFSENVRKNNNTESSSQNY